MKKISFLLSTLVVCLPGMSQSALKTDSAYLEPLRVIEAWLDAQIDYQDIPGISAAFVAGQDLVWSKGFGYSDLKLGKRTADSTIYSICSISKLFTSIGILQLRDQGLLDLDDSIQEHLPWLGLHQAFPESGPITIRALLTHSGGVPRDAPSPYWADPAFPFPSKKEFRDKLSEQETIYPASTSYQYSNLGISLLGLVIEELSGMPYEAYMRKYVIGPLGLKDTRPEMPEDLRRGRLATGYGVRSRSGEREELNFFQPGGIAPAAGFTSTVKDLARFASWNFSVLASPDDPVLNGNTLHEMQRIQYTDLIDDNTRGLGFGVYKDRRMYLVGHSGECPGYYSQFKMDPEKEWAVIVMLNTLGVSSSNLMYGIFQILYSYDRQRPARKEPGPDLEEYSGKYYSLWDGETMIVPWKGKLAVFNLRNERQSGPVTVAFHTEGDRFRRIRSDGSPGAEIRFERDAQGKVAKYWIHSFYMEKIE